MRGQETPWQVLTVKLPSNTDVKTFRDLRAEK